MQAGAIAPGGFYAGPAAQRMSVEEAALEFQTMLVAQLLKSMREAGKLYGEEDSESGASAEGYREIAERSFAAALARRDAFGLAKLIRKELDAAAPDVEITPTARQ